jgi:hypothetical protein
MSPDQYDEALNKLDDAGQSAPPGRVHHISGIGEGGTLWVLDVWETPEHFESFGEVLMPIMSGLDIEMGEPMITPLHNYIGG